jgi:DedD protein
MARTISDEELQLKQRARRRLIGAVVLVTAIVVVLPMILDSEPRQTTGAEVSVQIPSPDSGAFTSKAVPLNPASTVKPEPKAEQKAEPKPEPKVDPKAEPKPVAAPEPKAAPAAPAPAPAALAPVAQEAPKPAEKSAPTGTVKPTPAKEAAKPQAKAKPPAKGKDGQYVVQVIALADASRAKQMQQQIAAAGIKSYTEVVKTSKGEVTRVRAGPFATRGAAEKARDQLKALGMSGNVTTK